MKKNLYLLGKVFSICFFIAAIFSSCANPFSSGNGHVALRLPYGSTSSRTSRNADDELLGFSFKIKIYPRESEVYIYGEGKSGDKLVFTVPEGLHTVYVDAYDFNGNLCYSGEQAAEIKAGETTKVDILLEKCFEPSSDYMRAENPSNVNAILLTVNSAKTIGLGDTICLSEANSGITIATFTAGATATTTGLAFYYPFIQKGHLYEFMLHNMDKSVIYDKISIIAEANGDTSLFKSTSTVPTVKAGADAVVSIKPNPISTYLSSDVTNYKNINLKITIFGNESSSEYKFDGGHFVDETVNYVTNGSVVSSNSNLSALVGDGLNLMDKLDLTLGTVYDYAFCMITLNAELNSCSGQTFSKTFLSPIVKLEKNGGGGGGSSNWPDDTIDYDATKESNFLTQVNEASEGDTITLTSDLRIKSTLNITKSITIDGQDKYGLVLDNNADSTFEDVTFINGKGASTLADSEAARFGMIFYCSDKAVTFNRCTFKDNETEGSLSGGALALAGTGNVTVSSCSFINNKGGSGGSIDVIRGCTVTLISNNFQSSNGAYDVYMGSDSGKVLGSGNTTDKARNLFYCYWDGNSVQSNDSLLAN